MRRKKFRNLSLLVLATAAAAAPLSATVASAIPSGDPTVKPYEPVEFNNSTYDLEADAGAYALTVYPAEHSDDWSRYVTIFDREGEQVGFTDLHPGFTHVELPYTGSYRIEAEGAGSYMLVRNVRPQSVGDARVIEDTFTGESGYWIEHQSSNVSIDVEAPEPVSVVVYSSAHEIVRRMDGGRKLSCICPNSANDFPGSLYITLETQSDQPITTTIRVSAPLADGGQELPSAAGAAVIFAFIVASRVTGPGDGDGAR